MLLEMFRQVVSRYPGALLVLAPRHPERFGVVASLLASSGLRSRGVRQWDGAKPIAGGVFLLDTIGELASLYQFADIAFIGGSLVPHGGHNVLEAAQFGAAILVGPHTENFRDIVEVFRKANALRVVTPESLTPSVLQLLESDDEREGLGHNALEVVRSQQGATERTVSALLRLLPARSPANKAEVSTEQPRESTLCAIRRGNAGAKSTLRSPLYHPRLRGPVVSIGNIAAGGSGKTPFLIMLGELLNGAESRSMCFRAAMDALRKASRWSIPMGRRETSATSRC